MNKLIAVGNVVVLGVVLYVNFLAGAAELLGHSTGELSASYPSLFTPAGFTFSIWGVLYLLNIVFVLQQLWWAVTAPARFDTPLNLLFTVIGALNIGWLLAWHAERPGLAFVVMLALLGALISAFRRSAVRSERGLAAVPLRGMFGAYVGWISVATGANLFVLLSAAAPAPDATALVVGIMGALAVLCAAAAWMVIGQQSYAYAAVVAWALVGITAARADGPAPEPLIGIAASLGLIVLGGCVIVAIVRARRALASA